MKTIPITALAVSAFALISAPASAADIAVKAPPAAAVIPPPAFSWTGCYLGGNVGGAWQHNNTFDEFVDFDTGGDQASNVIGGGQVGCDYQFAGPWVIGIQGMFDWTDLHGHHPYVGGGSSPDETLSVKTNWVSTLTGRIGYSFWPKSLFYFKGGGAWARIDYSDVDPSVPYDGQANTTRTGWTVGGGFEYAFVPNWSWFVEYDYINLGSRNEQLTYGCGSICVFPNYSFPNPYPFNMSHNISEVMAGINYRFSWLGH